MNPRDGGWEIERDEKNIFVSINWTELHQKMPKIGQDNHNWIYYVIIISFYNFTDDDDDDDDDDGDNE